MAFDNFLSKLNWRLILVHFIASWFFMYAFAELLILHNFKFIMSLWDIIAAKKLGTHKFLPGDAERLVSVTLWMNYSYCFGLLTALIISLLISYKKRWYLLNSLIAFTIAFITWQFHIPGLQYLKMIFIAPGRFFSDHSRWFYITNGIVMLFLGLLLFFSKTSIHFINSKTSAKALPNQ